MDKIKDLIFDLSIYQLLLLKDYIEKTIVLKALEHQSTMEFRARK